MSRFVVGGLKDVACFVGDVENSDFSRTTVWFVLGIEKRPRLVKLFSGWMDRSVPRCRGSILLASHTGP
ncbi:hypothetical protein BT69DRAFT_1277694 [Atractiella rhizophila]|nr:hypothetical protein BT69DRAFT_1277694 [Atractiella rhizophila]